MLTVDKDLAKRVVKEINQLAAEDPNSPYSFINFCTKKKLLHDNDKVMHNGSLFICCPFHHDESPSLGIDEEHRMWNCLGCALHGNFIDFVRYYNESVSGSKISYYQQVNQLLSDDPALQKRVGASTIYKKESLNEPFTGLGYETFRLQSRKPKSYPELAKYMKRKKMSNEVIIFALLQMQSGIPADTIFDSLSDSALKTFKQEKIQNKPAYDIDSIMAEDNSPKKITDI